MKSIHVYRELRALVGPWSKANGFKRGSGGMLAYVRPEDTNNLVFWFQVSQDGWDDYAGSKFVVEFQLSEELTPGSVGGFRKRLPSFLTELELARVRQIQNSIIESLPRPPRDHLALSIDEQTSSWYLNKFRSISDAYSSDSDIWFRYHQAYHVRTWAEFVVSVLPRVTTDIAASPP